jgi:hypothetical protein
VSAGKLAKIPASERDDPALNRRRRSLRPILHAKFAQDILHMILRRGVGDIEAVSDLFILEPPTHQFQDLNLPHAEVRSR